MLCILRFLVKLKNEILRNSPSKWLYSFSADWISPFTRYFTCLGLAVTGYSFGLSYKCNFRKNCSDDFDTIFVVHYLRRKQCILWFLVKLKNENLRNPPSKWVHCIFFLRGLHFSFHKVFHSFGFGCNFRKTCTDDFDETLLVHYLW